MRSDTQRKNQVCVLGGNMAQWEKTHNTWGRLLELQLGLHDSVDPGIIVVTKHHPFWVSSGSRGIDERTTMPWSLILHPYLQLVLDFLVHFKVCETSESLNLIPILIVLSEVVIFRDYHYLPKL